MSALKLGVVGTNFVSSWLCEAARSLDSVKLFSLYSRTHEKGDAFAKAEGIEQVYTDFDAFLNSGIEAVYIASPTYCHYEMAKKALGAGLHAIVEKPIVMRESELSELILLAEKQGLALFEAMRPQFDSSVETVKNALSTLGKVRTAHFEFCQ